MSERTGSRVGKPPPVPKDSRRGTTVVPPATPGSSSRVASSSDEATQKLNVSLIDAAVTGVSELLADEHEALVSSNGSDDAVADVNVRLALLGMELGADDDKLSSHCALAVNNPLTIELMRSITLGADDATAFAGAVAELESLIDARPIDEQNAIRATIAEAWLFRWGKANDSVETVTRALEGLPESVQPEAESLATLALASLEAWGDLEAYLAESEDAADIAEAAQVAYDRLDDPSRSFELLDRLDGQKGEYAFYGSSLRYQLQIAQDSAPTEIRDLLIARLALLESDAPKSAEGNATRFALAEVRELTGDHKEAQDAFADLTTRTGWSTSIAQLAALRVALRRNDWPTVVEIGRASCRERV